MVISIKRGKIIRRERDSTLLSFYLSYLCFILVFQPKTGYRSLMLLLVCIREQYVQIPAPNTIKRTYEILGRFKFGCNSNSNMYKNILTDLYSQKGEVVLVTLSKPAPTTKSDFS